MWLDFTVTVICITFCYTVFTEPYLNELWPYCEQFCSRLKRNWHQQSLQHCKFRIYVWITCRSCVDNGDVTDHVTVHPQVNLLMLILNEEKTDENKMEKNLLP